MRDDAVAPECEAAREAMSASLDGEPSPLSTGWLTAHLVECGACRAWYLAAAEIRRRSRLALVPKVPDHTDRILRATTAAPARQPTHRAGRRRVGIARLLLVCAAAVQLWFALPVLLFARDNDVSVHPAHELGSFDTALAVGFLVVARRPRLARGMRPLVGVIATLLVVTAIVDLVHGGRTTIADEAPHLIAAFGFLLMCLVAGPPQTRVTQSNVAPLPSPQPARPAGASGTLRDSANSIPTIATGPTDGSRATA
jgi:predicted anti-sigma-YlaC factor YlaD